MLALARDPNFRRLWLAQIVLALGDATMQMGLLELFRSYGYKVTVETAKLLFAVALPGLLFGPVAMAYLDRWQRRHVLLISDALRALIIVGVAVWLLPRLSGRVAPGNLLLVYAAIFAIGIVTTFYYPARYALIPNLVPSQSLIKANTLFTSSIAVAAVAGRPLGGLVAELLGIEWAVLSNALAYLISVALIWQIVVKPVADAPLPVQPPGSGLAELRLGLRYIWQHPLALRLTLLAGVFAFQAAVFIVAFAGYAYETLRLGTAGLGYLAAAAALGAVGGIVALSRSRRWAHSPWLAFGQLLCAGVALVVLSLVRQPWAAVPLLIVLGAVVATATIPIDAKLQAAVDDARRGAVFAARGMVTSGVMVAGFWLQFGTQFFQHTPPPVVLFGLGSGSVGVAVLTFLVLRGDRSAAGAKEVASP